MDDLATTTLEERREAAVGLIHDHIRGRDRVDGPLLLSYIIWPTSVPWWATMDAMSTPTCKREDCHEPAAWTRGPYAHLCAEHADEKRNAKNRAAERPVSAPEPTQEAEAVDMPPEAVAPQNGSQRLGDLAVKVGHYEFLLDSARREYREALEAELERLA